MFDSSSRYASSDDAILEIGDETTSVGSEQGIRTNGRRQVRYIKRRILPKGEEISSYQEVTVKAGDRLDLIANRVLGDPLQFWQICDANDAMYPPELTVQPGQVLKIAFPWS